MEPLNPTLYSLLVRRFGDVSIVHAGEPMQAVHVSGLRQSLIAPDRQRPRLRIYQSGEEYMVSCPFCNDTRKRLYINHRWGVLDNETGTRNLWLMQCFNENCNNSYENQSSLHEQLMTFAGQQRAMRLRPGSENLAPKKLLQIKHPGPLCRLDELARHQPHHQAIEYLRGRGFDPAYLGRRYGIAYCAESNYPLAINRIIIPIYMEQQLVGWQARLIGEFVKDGPPKYWSCPGMIRSQLAYNFELAVQHDTILIVEGPADVWGAGPQALGVLGKSMSQYMQRLLRVRASSDATVVLVLDPKQDEKEAVKGRPHHIEKLYDQLATPFHGRLVKVYLPEDKDPGSLERGVLRNYIREAATAQNVRVSFRPPQRAVSV